MIKSYLEKHGWTAPIFDLPIGRPKIIVCIPALAEDGIWRTLDALEEAQKRYSKQVLVLVLFNHSEKSLPEDIESNERHYGQFMKRMANRQLDCQAHLMSLPKKHAGVGLARKIIMDEAVRIFEQLKIADGIIAATDADTVVATNYFRAIDDFFRSHPTLEAASIRFEHILEGLTDEEKKGIIRYELHLRYFVEAQKMTGLPTAFQTIGSAMAVRHTAYQLQGGMNKRQAGEDFYFLQKFARKRTLGDLSNTVVYPSARFSHRVPFGTGRAMHQMSSRDWQLTTHQIQVFDEIKVLFDLVKEYHSFSNEQLVLAMNNMPVAVAGFLSENDFVNRMTEIQQHTSGQAAFVKRFFNWFDSFLMMKYVHFAGDKYHPDGNVVHIAGEFAKRMGWGDFDTEMDLLAIYRRR